MKRFLPFFILIFALLLSGCTPVASTGSIQGWVYTYGGTIIVVGTSSAPSGYVPVAGATVTVEGQAVTALTDAGGGFTISGLNPGIYVVNVDFNGETATGQARVTAGGTGKVGEGLPATIDGYVHEVDYTDGTRTWSSLVISDNSYGADVPYGAWETYVQNGMALTTRQLYVFLDGRQVGRLSSGHFTISNITSGSHSIQFSENGTSKTAAVTFLVYPGTYTLALPVLIQAPWNTGDNLGNLEY